MKKTIFVSGILLATLFAASTAMADGPRPPAPPAPRLHAMPAPPPVALNININLLERRIEANVASGKLTHSEERQVRSQLLSLKASIKAARQDRRITAWERTSLERKEARLNKNISELSNNRAVARNRDDRHDERRDDRPQPRNH